MPQRYNSYVVRPSGNNFNPTDKHLARRTFRRKLIVVLLLLVVFCGLYFLHAKHISAKENARLALAARAIQRVGQQQDFESSVQATINKNPDIDLAVSAVNLNDGSVIKMGDSSAMNAASCGKVLTAVLFLRDVEQGSESLDEPLGGASSQYELQQLIQESNDNAWVLFNDELGHPALYDYAYKLGLQSYNPNTDSISASDMSFLLQKLYNSQLLNPQYTKLLLSYMQNTNYENFISPAVPSYYQIYHKVGFYSGQINDTAIIVGSKQKFVLTIFSNSNSDFDASTRATIMQQITRAALLYIY